MLCPFNGIQPEVDQTVFIAPGAVVAGRVTIGANSSIWYNAVIRGDTDTVTIGSGTNIQDGAVLHVQEGFPLSIGDRVTVGHRVILHGCKVEDDAFIGMGAIVLNGAHVGAGAVVAAGALVLQGQRIPAGMLAMGHPAKVIRPLTAEELATFQRAATKYIKLADLHGRKSI